MRRLFHSPSFIIFASLLNGSYALAQQAPPLWGNLRPGPHSVGFRSTWQRDFSRRYDIEFDDKTRYAAGKSPRPILINVWYPAKVRYPSASMRHREYLAIGSDDPQLARIGAKLADYERTIVCKEVMDKKPKELTEKESRLLDEFWGTPTASHRDAPPVDGRFPMVIYHSGFGSSYEDNAVLCEFLASHGYLVVGSAFQRPDGREFNIDGGHGSARDFEFLIAYGARLPNVDWQHIGVIGHSGGAQAALLFRAHDASTVDAVVSLDTTEDYCSLATKWWDDLEKYLLDHVDNVDGPLLIAANDHAILELADALVKADRYYLITRELDHNDFISQGIVRKWLGCRAKPDDVALEESYAAARAQYEAVCRQALLFFDAHLKGDPRRLEQLARESEEDGMVASRPHLRHVRRGVAGAEPFPLGSPAPPSPRQIRALMARIGVEPTLKLLERYHETGPFAPVFHERVAFALVDEFIELGRIRDAIAVDRVYAKFGSKNSRMYFALGVAYEEDGNKSRAIDLFNKALLLDPADAKAARHLKTLRASQSPAKGSSG